MIVTANHHFGLASRGAVSSAVEWTDRIIARAAIRRGIHLGPVPKGANVLVAEVNHGAWQIPCPNPDCGGSEYAWEEGDFMCLSCFNAHVNHCYLRARFPKARREIEAILDLRPEPNRNWQVHDSVADLQIENIEHDIPLPVEV